MELKVKRLVPEAKIPEYKSAGAAAFDLATIETRTLLPGEIHKFRTGLAFCVPDGHFLMIACRGSNAIKKGVGMPNGMGVIDPDFCGENDEVCVILQNVTSNPVTIQAGDRLAQGMIVPVPRMQLTEVESTGFADRGGFGSTGQ